MNNSNYELILKGLLSEKNIVYKTQKSEKKIKICCEDKDYFVTFPDYFGYNDVEIKCKNSLELLEKINEVFHFSNFDKLVKRINFYEKAIKYIQLNEVQINLLLPNRKKAIWFESCYSDLDGAILNFNYKNNNYILALENKLYDIKVNGKNKKVRQLSTEFCDEDRLIRNNIFSDNDFKMATKVKVIVYKNKKVVDKIYSEKVLDYLGKVLRYEKL